MEDTLPVQKSFVNHALKNGSILAIIGILLTLSIYLIDVSWFASLWLILIILITNISYTTIVGINYRKEIGGYLSFKNAFIYAALVLFSAMAISRIFSLILFNVVDPQVSQIVTDASVEKWTALMEGWNTPQEKIDEAIDKMKIDIPKSFSPIGILISIFWPGLVFIAIAAAISGGIVKKNQPELMS